LKDITTVVMRNKAKNNPIRGLVGKGEPGGLSRLLRDSPYRKVVRASDISSAFSREIPMMPGGVVRPFVGCQKRADGRRETAEMKCAEAAVTPQGRIGAP
jgi:hypothetical protein